MGKLVLLAALLPPTPVIYFYQTMRLVGEQQYRRREKKVPLYSHFKRSQGDNYSPGTASVAGDLMPKHEEGGGKQGVWP